jgi:glycosyltransferase involved in cell wall biosynthesis
MRVAIDARHLGRGRGIARYVEQMLIALVDRFPDDEWVAVVPGHRPVSVPNAAELQRTRLPSRPLYAAAAISGSPRLDELAGGSDVCWIPAPAPVALSAGKPYVLTIHDRSFEADPSQFTRYERIWHRVARPRNLAARATEVVVISESSLNDLVAAGWPIDPAHTTVIGAGASPSVAPAHGIPGSGRPTHLLYVGALEPRKGIETLSAAIGKMRDDGHETPVVVVGEGRLSGFLDGLSGVRVLERQSDTQLATLYADSIALVVPSNSEGFGSPSVEAATHCVPSVTTDLPIFRETLGAGHLSFPANDASALAAALSQICADSRLRDSLGEAAAAAVSGRTWPTAAEHLHSVLMRAAG